jgi:hypothetical protein
MIVICLAVNQSNSRPPLVGGKKGAFYFLLMAGLNSGRLVGCSGPRVLLSVECATCARLGQWPGRGDSQGRQRCGDCVPGLCGRERRPLTSPFQGLADIWTRTQAYGLGCRIVAFQAGRRFCTSGSKKNPPLAPS